HDAGEAAGQHYLVMEFVPGIDLAGLVRARGPLRTADASAIIRQAAVGLQYAHERGLIHRDVKPSNLLLSPADGPHGATVKLLDLGLALLRGDAAETDPGLPVASEAPTLTSAEALTSASCVVGTNEYMAPEQWRDPHGVSVRADLYSLGCTLYYL